ncbi:hypothetical protein PPYR_08772 [Photinus pyralis]|uniref:Cuticle protein 6 n=1 Tax=Photinus pyralis TaxID=7054 RepID=A0A5N4AKE1_PHOPY|nr:uncharacterized protein LOC116171634 [Photinus pyralis]KAB0797779.1 hypothetical protein PPYR_08772 [Photinus pyralis]
MRLLILGLLLSAAWAEEVRLVELEPDHAAQYINQQDQTLKYAPKIESNVPSLRYIGNHPEHVNEDIYLANQYHGQDGLGAYVYGYSVPDIAKTEKKERSGNLKGAYNYIAGNGQEIKVQYWDDGTGFHQIDNVPKDQPEDNPEVKAAKEEHLRIWHEQALRNSQAPPDPYSNQYNNFGAQSQSLQNQYQQYQGQIAHPQQPQVQSQYQPQIPQAPQPQHVSAPLHNQPIQHIPTQVLPQHPSANSVDYSGQYSNNQQSWVQSPAAADNNVNAAASAHVDGIWAHAGASQQQWAQGPARPHQEEEETGPPKGFFYSFDYPVGIIVGKEGQNLEAAYNQNKELFEKQLKGEGPRPSGSSSSYHASA